MKKCGSTTLVLYVALLVLFLVSQIKVSSIFKLLAAMSSRSTDQGFGKTVVQTIAETTQLMSLAPQHAGANAGPALATPIICNRSHLSYDICSINAPTVMDPNVSTFYVTVPTESIPQVEKIQPYPRKWDPYRMYHIKQINLRSGPSTPPCAVQHNASALVFSVAGYEGDFFTDFYDEFIPLFITINSVLSGRDYVLVIANAHDWWMWKYAELIRSFTKYPIINLYNDTTTHCFPSATIGLISLDLKSKNPKPLPHSKTIVPFHALLEKTYRSQNSISTSLRSRPRLVLAGRKGAIGRLILNQAEVKRVAEEEGFDVIEFEPKYATSMRKAYEIVSSSHAMLGVHGAVLTHFLFLRPGSVFLQVVPLGMQWFSEVYFGIMAREMRFEYMEYKIGVGESSLVEKYGKDDMMIKNPEAFIENKGWCSETVEIYLKKQNVRLDLVRLRGELKKAFVTAKAFMEREG